MPSETMILTKRFEEALVFTSHEHRKQLRKGSNIPYVSHLLAVAGIVLEYGGSEDEAIAALLHDAVEDQGGTPMLDKIRGLFGTEVADIVEGCTDSFEEEWEYKSPWKQRKRDYIDHVRSASPSIRLVSAADKLHNARSILRDYRECGETLWHRFHAGRKDQLWYYRSLVQSFRVTQTVPGLVDELDRTVTELEHMVRQKIGAPRIKENA